MGQVRKVDNIFGSHSRDRNCGIFSFDRRSTTSKFITNILSCSLQVRLVIAWLVKFCNLDCNILNRYGSF